MKNTSYSDDQITHVHYLKIATRNSICLCCMPFLISNQHHIQTKSHTKHTLCPTIIIFIRILLTNVDTNFNYQVRMITTSLLQLM